MRNWDWRKPDRYVWTLRTRETQPGLSCPWMVYGVIKRNFDPVTWQPSSYVNGTLYSYRIFEICSGGPPLAQTVPFTVDPWWWSTYPVTSMQHHWLSDNIPPRLTRDDVGGLRYIYGTNNVNWESMSSDSTMFSTNIAGGQQLLITSNLTLLAAQALTNNAAALQILVSRLEHCLHGQHFHEHLGYQHSRPILPITPWIRSARRRIWRSLTNRTLTVQSQYRHIFDNLVTFQFTNGAWVMVPVPDVTAPHRPGLLYRADHHRDQLAL